VGKKVSQSSNGQATVKQPPRAKKPKSKPLDYSGFQAGQQIIDDWITNRKSAKGAITQTVIDQHVKEFNKMLVHGWNHEECMSEQLTRGWRAFKADWAIKGIKEAEKASEVDLDEMYLNIQKGKNNGHTRANNRPNSSSKQNLLEQVDEKGVSSRAGGNGDGVDDRFSDDIPW